MGDEMRGDDETTTARYRRRVGVCDFKMGSLLMQLCCI